jgi:hypothetical protein
MRTFIHKQLSTPLRCMRLKSYVLVDWLIHPSFVVAGISLFLVFIKHVYSILDLSVFPVTFRPTFAFQSNADVTMSVMYCVCASCWEQWPQNSIITIHQDVKDGTSLLSTSLNWVEFNKTVTRNQGAHPSVGPFWLRSDVTPCVKEFQLLADLVLLFYTL